MMAKSLVIVESPAKAKTIKKILGRGYDGLPSMGHVKDLPRSRLGVDVENGFAPSYIVIRERKKVLSEILSAARSVKTVYLAPDPDREGEAIAWHIAEEIRSDAAKQGRKRKGKGKGKAGEAGTDGGKSAAPPPAEIRRVLFHEITKKGVTQ